jgi:hypothetical protein
LRINYLHSRSPGGARNVLASIREALVQLSEQPHSGLATDEPDVRVMFLRYPYKIFYRVREDAIEVDSHSPHRAPAVAAKRRAGSILTFSHHATGNAPASRPQRT